MEECFAWLDRYRETPWAALALATAVDKQPSPMLVMGSLEWHLRSSDSNWCKRLSMARTNTLPTRGAARPAGANQQSGKSENSAAASEGAHARLVICSRCGKRIEECRCSFYGRLPDPNWCKRR